MLEIMLTTNPQPSLNGIRDLKPYYLGPLLYPKHPTILNHRGLGGTGRRVFWGAITPVLHGKIRPHLSYSLNSSQGVI